MKQFGLPFPVEEDEDYVKEPGRMAKKLPLEGSYPAERLAERFENNVSGSVKPIYILPAKRGRIEEYEKILREPYLYWDGIILDARDNLARVKIIDEEKETAGDLADQLDRLSSLTNEQAMITRRAVERGKAEIGGQERMTRRSTRLSR